MIIKHSSPTTYNLQPNRGFIMLFSVLISSLLVAVGLSIFNLTLKEITLSTAGRESQIAFYAANSGMECALYWDLVGNGTRSAFASNNKETSLKITCGNFSDTPTVSSTGVSATTDFSFKIKDAGDEFPCVKVTVEKEEKKIGGIDKIQTTIKSQGNNICVGGRRVQRGLESTMTRIK